LPHSARVARPPVRASKTGGTTAVEVDAAAAGLDVLPARNVALSVAEAVHEDRPARDPRSDMTPAQLMTQNQTAIQLNDTRGSVAIAGTDDLRAAHITRRNLPRQSAGASTVADRPR
jgi:hypothetical protein